MKLLSIDLNTTRITNQNYQNLLNSINCDKLEIHIYNYIKTKHSKLEFSNGEVLHPYTGSRKKIALDIPQALDIVEQAALNKFEQIIILCGEFEGEFLYNKLNQLKINYYKISPSELRMLDTSSIELQKQSISHKQQTQELMQEKLLLQKSTENIKLSPEQIKTLIKYIKLKKEKQTTCCSATN